MQFNPLVLKDKTLFDRFLNAKGHEISTYAFANIFVWRGLFEISWVIMEKNLCIFFKDRMGLFLYLPPLGKRQSESLIKKCFDIMDRFNLNKDISRIENAEESDTGFFRSLGYKCVHKASDYIYRSKELLELKGDRFKSKRAAYNYFVKHYQPDLLPYSLRYKNDCIGLYRDWAVNRKGKSSDPIYIGMLEDNFICQKLALGNYKKLNLIGRIIKINNQIKGYTFGFRLNKNTFCVLSETVDLNIKGASQFIFRKFIEEFKSYQYINIMDDSGLENLRRVKLSYRPLRLAPAYIVKRWPNV